MRRRLAVILAIVAASCSNAPDAADLQDSFARQLAANKFVSGFQRSGDDMTFTAPGPDGTDTAQWRVHIDSAAIEPQDDERQPFKGTVKSTWTADGTAVVITGSRSNLPFELLSNGLSQDCWAFWDPATKTWGWE